MENLSLKVGLDEIENSNHILISHCTCLIKALDIPKIYYLIVWIIIRIWYKHPRNSPNNISGLHFSASKEIKKSPLSSIAQSIWFTVGWNNLSRSIILEPVYSASRLKKVSDQLLVRGIGDLWMIWMIINWFKMSLWDPPDYPRLFWYITIQNLLRFSIP